jgi:hypothetical protein
MAPGKRLKDLATIDRHAQDVLDSKLASPGAETYKGMVLFYDKGSNSERSQMRFSLRALGLQCPIAFSDRLIAGREVEIAASKKLPSRGLFVEKPFFSAYSTQFSH